MNQTPRKLVWRLRSLVNEAIASPQNVMISGEKLNAMSDEQLRGLIEMCEKIIRERASSTKQNSFKTVRDAAAFLIDVALGDEEHDDDLVTGALKTLSNLDRATPQNIERIEDLVGSMSNTAWMLNQNEFDDEDEHFDAEASQEQDYGKLQRALTTLGFKFDKKGAMAK